MISMEILTVVSHKFYCEPGVNDRSENRSFESHTQRETGQRASTLADFLRIALSVRPKKARY